MSAEDTVTFLLGFTQTMINLIGAKRLECHDMGIVVLLSEGYSQCEIASHMHRDQSWVSRRVETIRHELKLTGLDWMSDYGQETEGCIVEL